MMTIGDFYDDGRFLELLNAADSLARSSWEVDLCRQLRDRYIASGNRAVIFGIEKYQMERIIDRYRA